MSDFSLTQQKGIPLKNNQKSSNPLSEVVSSMYNKTPTPVINIVKKNATSAEVAQNAAAENSATADMPVIDNTLTGISSDLTPANSAGMNVKTNGGDEKKYQLGFSLSGYKSIIQKNTQESANKTGFGGFDEGNIKWVVSCFGAGESSTTGFKQCKWNVSGDGYGWTIGRMVNNAKG